MTRYPKSLLTGTFLMMLLCPLAPIVLNDPRLGDEMKMFLMPSKSNIPDTKDADAVWADVGVLVLPIKSFQLLRSD